jgi:hypothetical protein
MIQIFEILYLVLSNMHVTCFKHVILVMGSMAHTLTTYEQILTITKFVSSKFVAGMKRKHTVKKQTLLSVMRCVNTDNIEYPYSLYLLVLTVRDVSDTGTQIHLLVY